MSAQTQIVRYAYRVLSANTGAEVAYRLEESFIFAGDTIRKTYYPEEYLTKSEFTEFLKQFTYEVESDYWKRYKMYLFANDRKNLAIQAYDTHMASKGVNYVAQSIDDMKTFLSDTLDVTTIERTTRNNKVKYNLVIDWTANTYKLLNLNGTTATTGSVTVTDNR
ncbi:MAG: hypothetical protein D6746_12225, partial [Bacteroidetes bacterium]